MECETPERFRASGGQEKDARFALLALGFPK
jgi:hypothetical protein